MCVCCVVLCCAVRAALCSGRRVFYVGVACASWLFFIVVIFFLVLLPRRGAGCCLHVVCLFRCMFGFRCVVFRDFTVCTQEIYDTAVFVFASILVLIYHPALMFFVFVFFAADPFI